MLAYCIKNDRILSCVYNTPAPITLQPSSKLQRKIKKYFFSFLSENYILVLFTI